MEKSVNKLCEAICLEVACERNEQEDIMCGGPVMLGYTFYVLKDENLNDIKTFIIECLHKYNRPYINTTTIIKNNFNVKYLTSKDAIEQEIKNNTI